MIGIAVRVAQRLALHRDGAQFGMPPFEIEQRRRLWWNIVILDKRVAVIAGSTVTALGTAQTDCKRPLNINDTDIHPGNQETPISSDKPTEMVFILARIELGLVTAPDAVRPLPMTDKTVTLPAHRAYRSPTEMDSFCSFVEDTHLKHCNSDIALQFYTTMTARQNLSKLQLLSSIKRFATDAETVPLAEREWLFTEAIYVIEYDNTVHSSKSCQGYLWYTHTNFNFPAYLVLAHELRLTPSGALCERAWAAITENHKHRGTTTMVQSPMHIALGNLLLLAWRAREAISTAQGQVLQAPDYIVLLQELVVKNNSSRTTRDAPASSPMESFGPAALGLNEEDMVPDLVQEDGQMDWLYVSQLASVYDYL